MARALLIALVLGCAVALVGAQQPGHQKANKRPQLMTSVCK